MKRLLIDVDGVLRRFVDKAVEVYNNLYGERVAVREVKEFELHLTLRKLKDISGTVRFIEENGRQLFEDSLPYPEVPEVMRRLHKQHRIHIVTSQFPGLETHTLNWLKKFDIPYHEISFTSKKSFVIGDFFLDDKLKNLQQYSEAWRGLATVVSVKRPWNLDWDGLCVPNLLAFEELVSVTK